MKGPVEITLARPDPPHQRYWHIRDGDVAVLRIGRTLAAVDTTFSSSDEFTRRWLAEASAAARGRGRRVRAPLVAGLVALRGHDPADRATWGWRDADFRPNDHANPVRCVALCLGGSRAIVYSPEAYGGPRVRRAKFDGDRLRFDGDNNMAQLRAFLDDKRITVACFGAREATRKLAREWGLHVASPEELTHLFALAYGKAEGVEAQKKPSLDKPADKYWMGKAALARAKAKADRDGYDTDEEEEAANLGATRRPPKVVSGLSLERMARVALGPEMRLARCPAKVAQADWGNYYLDEDQWAYATRDAYLCFEIAARCLQKLGDRPTGA